MGTVCCWAAPRHILCLPRDIWGTQRHTAGATEARESKQRAALQPGWAAQLLAVGIHLPVHFAIHPIPVL